jgi:hypothetical protein
MRIVISMFEFTTLSYKDYSNVVEQSFDMKLKPIPLSFRGDPNVIVYKQAMDFWCV